MIILMTISPKFNEEDKTKFDEAIVITDNNSEELDNFSYILEENKLNKKNIIHTYAF